MWKSIGLVLLSGAIAGSMVGVLEALNLLLAVGAGEYDVLLWGGVGYALLGCVLSSILCTVSWAWTPPQIFTRTFSLTVFVLSMWTFTFSPWWLLCIVPLHWLQRVFLERTPLRVLLTPKGGIGCASVWFALLLTFSLTPSKRIYAPPIHRENAAGKPNVLVVVIDGLPSDFMKLGATPEITAFKKSVIVFDNAFSNASNRFGGLAALLSSSTKQLQSPLSESMQTLPETMAYQGYQTYGLVSHLTVGRFVNLHQGFDRFRYIPPRVNSMVFRLGLGNEGTRHLKLARYILNRFTNERRSIDEVIQVFKHDIGQLDKGKTSPWFGLLHLSPSQPIDRNKLNQLDHGLGMLFREINLQECLVVLTASFQQGQLQEFRRFSVPLMFWLPNATSRSIGNNVLLSDVAPTITSILGVPSDQSWDGQNAFRLPPIDDQRVIEVSQPNWTWRQQGQWRWVQQHRKEALYDVVADPNMESNVVNQHPQRAQQLRNNSH
jgi:hypothetical protein